MHKTAVQQHLCYTISVDSRISAIAAKQHGHVSRQQLLDANVTPAMIRWRLEHARLHKTYRGVYAVGCPTHTTEGRWMASVLSAGNGAALSHFCAASLWGLIRYQPRVTQVITASRLRPLREFQLIRTATLRQSDLHIKNCIPVTGVERTIFDLGGHMTAHQLARLLDEARYRESLNTTRLNHLLELHTNYRGHAVVVQALDLHLHGSAGTKSRLEDQFLRLVAAAQLPRPQVNHRLSIGGRRIEVDFLWQEAQLCVEVDGVGHKRARTRDVDAVRDVSLVAAGYTVVRVTPAQVQDPVPLISRLQTLLSRLEE